MRDTARAAGTNDRAPPVTQASVPGAEEPLLRPCSRHIPRRRLHQEAAGPACPLKGDQGPVEAD